MNVGLIGAGNYGRELIRFINLVKGINLAGVADVSKESLLKAVELSNDKPFITGDYRELLARCEVEAVIIAVPNNMMADMSIEAMEAGKGVYLEKSMAAGISECKRIISTHEKTGVPLMVGLQLRYGDMFRKIKEIVDSGMIGAVRMMWYKEIRGPFIPGWEGWRESLASTGGTLVEKCTHHFDLFNWFAGTRPSRVSGFGGGDVVYMKTGMLDNALVLVEYENNVRAGLGLSLFSPCGADDTGFMVIGEKGVVYQKKDEIILKTGDGDKNTKTYRVDQPYAGLGHGGTEYNALTAFAAYISRGEKPLTDARVGLESLSLAIAAQLAVSEKRVVSFDEVLNG